MASTHSNFQVLATFNLAATGSQVVDIDTTDLNELQIGTLLTYAATSNPSNCTLTWKKGFGQVDTTNPGKFVYVGGNEAFTPHFEATGTTVTLATATPGVGVLTALNIDLTQVPGWVRLTLTNLDTANGCSVVLYGDI